MQVAAKKRLMQRIERVGLKQTFPLEKMRFEIEVPWSDGLLGTRTEFIGVQHDATILVMIVKEWIEPGGAPNKEKTEKRTVVRVKDGMIIEYLGMHYIGSSNAWHLFEVGGGLKINTKKVANVPAVTVKES